jgi:hypothetical protein
MKCRCIKDYRDSNVNFKVNEIYEFITVTTSSQYPPLYKIYNGKRAQKIFNHIEFKTYFRMAA